MVPVVTMMTKTAASETMGLMVMMSKGIAVVLTETSESKSATEVAMAYSVVKVATMVAVVIVVASVTKSSKPTKPVTMPMTKASVTSVTTVELKTLRS